MGDISGDDFATIFANSIDGEHRSSPIGVADVEWNGCAWSAKTIKDKSPFAKSKVRLISGRNSPDYSMGIDDPHADINETGKAVLSIWNSRLDEALDEHDDLRIIVLVRNIDTREFLLFEEEAQRFVPGEYAWSYNKRRNLQGLHKQSGKHIFTWQFHGSQFTIFRDVPSSSRRFRIVPDVPTLSEAGILEAMKFTTDWIGILQ
ncbi:MAG: hypothetical protein OXE46_06000 [Chloroflexi bacterium]|nr:hypothetical protein [Chloroflexota bacterium]